VTILLRYNFDMYCLGSVQAPSELASASGKKSSGKSQGKAVLAVFRDKKTIEAVAVAPPIVRLFLEEAGFCAKDENSEQYSDQALTTDPDVRRVLVKQLTASLSNRAMKKALARTVDNGQFNFHDFIAYIIADDQRGAAAGLSQFSDDSKVNPRRPNQVKTTGARRRARPV
jgi:hypothetical protein